jgi:S1-C subfamily serine protease
MDIFTKHNITNWLYNVILLSCVTLTVSINAQSPLQETWTSIFEHTKNNVVQIFAYGTTYNWATPYKQGQPFACRGTGTVVSAQGDIYTNYHVVASAHTISIQHPLLWKEKFVVDFLGASPSSDLAHLRINPEELKRLLDMITIKRLDYLPLGDSDTMKQGNEIIVIGYPLGQENIKHSIGTISGQETSIIGGERFTLDASAYPGNSGGPVINNRGEVIGFLCAVATNDGQAVERISYAIPVNRLKALAGEMENGTILGATWWGLEFAPTTVDTLIYLGCKNGTGVYISRVHDGSLADRAGIKAGDIITHINGLSVDRFGYITTPWADYCIAFDDLLERIKNGDHVEFSVSRNGTKLTCSVEKCPLSHCDVKNYHHPFDTEPSYDVFGGMVFMEMTKNHISLFMSDMIFDILPLIPLADEIPYAKGLEQLKFIVGNEKNTPHVIITHVFPETDPGKSSMFGPFDCIVSKVNTIPVHTIAELQEAICKGASSGYMLIETRYGTKLVLPLNKILSQEKKLADKYDYQLSPLVERLKSFTKKANLLQTELRP